MSFVQYKRGIYFCQSIKCESPFLPIPCATNDKPQNTTTKQNIYCEDLGRVFADLIWLYRPINRPLRPVGADLSARVGCRNRLVESKIGLAFNAGVVCQKRLPAH